MEEQIQKALSQTAKEILEIDFNSLPQEAKNYPLLSAKFGIEPYQMIAFMEAVEEKFNIKVPESAIAERKFNTFHDIVHIIISEKGEK